MLLIACTDMPHDSEPAWALDGHPWAIDAMDLDGEGLLDDRLLPGQDPADLDALACAPECRQCIALARDGTVNWWTFDPHLESLEAGSWADWSTTPTGWRVVGIDWTIAYLGPLASPDDWQRLVTVSAIGSEWPFYPCPLDIE